MKSILRLRMIKKLVSLRVPGFLLVASMIFSMAQITFRLGSPVPQLSVNIAAGGAGGSDEGGYGGSMGGNDSSSSTSASSTAGDSNSDGTASNDPGTGDPGDTSDPSATTSNPSDPTGFGVGTNTELGDSLDRQAQQNGVDAMSAVAAGVAAAATAANPDDPNAALGADTSQAAMKAYYHAVNDTYALGGVDPTAQGLTIGPIQGLMRSVGVGDSYGDETSALGTQAQSLDGDYRTMPSVNITVPGEIGYDASKAVQTLATFSTADGQSVSITVGIKTSQDIPGMVAGDWVAFGLMNSLTVVAPLSVVNQITAGAYTNPSQPITGITDRSTNPDSLSSLAPGGLVSVNSNADVGTVTVSIHHEEVHATVTAVAGISASPNDPTASDAQDAAASLQSLTTSSLAGVASPSVAPTIAGYSAAWSDHAEEAVASIGTNDTDNFTANLATGFGVSSDEAAKIAQVAMNNPTMTGIANSISNYVARSLGK